MDRDLLAKADSIVASLSPGKRETVREIVVNSVHHGRVDDSAKRYLTAASGSSELADILTAALGETQKPAQLPTSSNSDRHSRAADAS